MAARVFRLGEIGQNGIIRLHIRPGSVFIADNREVKNRIAAMIASADDVAFGVTEGGREIFISVGVKNVVKNWDKRYADETYPNKPDIERIYHKMEEIV